MDVVRFKVKRHGQEREHFQGVVDDVTVFLVLHDERDQVGAYKIPLTQAEEHLPLVRVVAPEETLQIFQALDAVSVFPINFLLLIKAAKPSRNRYEEILVLYRPPFLTPFVN